MGAKVRAKRRRMCAGKVRHRTAVAAGIHADAVYQKHGDWIKPYRCRFCGGYHCGH